MPLTEEEKVLVYEADLWNYPQEAHGCVDRNGRLHLIPDLLIAMSRGLEIEIEKNRAWIAGGEGHHNAAAVDLFNRATEDLAQFCGYDDPFDFLDAAAITGKDILPPRST